MQKILKKLVVFSMLGQLLYAMDMVNYAVDASDTTLQKSITLFGGKKEADTYFHSYYQLIDAIHIGNVTEVKALVESIGTDAKVPYEGYFHSPLVVALENNKYDIAKYLLEHEADPNRYMDEYNSRITALMFLADEDKPKYIDLLLEYGADANLQSSDGYTALHYALGMASAANEEIINTLIPLTDLNKPIKQYALTYKKSPATALTIAFKFSRKYSIIDALIDAGANAGKSDAEKHEFIKAFIKYRARLTNNEKLYTYAKVALSQTKESHNPKVEHDLIFLYAELYELAIITGHPLSKETLKGFKNLSKKYLKAKAYLEMLSIVEASKNEVQTKALQAWQKKYISLVKNEWCFSVLKKWGQSFDGKEENYVIETVITLEKMNHP